VERIVIAKVTGSGQVSLPAAVRRRWGVSQVFLADEGDRVVVRPLPEHPIKAACGSLARHGGPTERVRSEERRVAERAERRRLGT